MLKCLGEPLGPSASPVRGPEACWVTDVMVRAPNLGAAGKQPCVPFPSPRCWAGGRSFTLVPSWELEGELSSTLWLPALLSKEAVSGLEAKLCCCPGPALLQPRSPSAPEAASGSGWCWDFPPCSCAGGQCWGGGLQPACPSTLHHSPAVGALWAGSRGAWLCSRRFSMEAPCGRVPGGDCGLQLQGLKQVPECWQQPACCVPVSQGCRQGKRGQPSQPAAVPRRAGQHPASLPLRVPVLALCSCMGASPMLCSGYRAHRSRVWLRAEQQG